MKGKYKELYSQETTGNSVPEGGLISFLFELNKHWPLMFAIEQRQEFRDMTNHVANWIDSIRQGSGKREVYASSYIGIFGQEVKGDGIMTRILDYKVHNGKPVFDLGSLEKMADAVDKRLNKNQH